MSGVFQITVNGTALSFTANAEQDLLSQALSQGVAWPAGCRAGGCGSCKARVVSGQFHQTPDALALSAQDVAQGTVLLCQTYPKSDMQLQSFQTIGALAAQKPRIARLIELRPVGDVAILRLQLQGAALDYKAGQFVNLLLKDGSERSYSMATPPTADGVLELHVRRLPGGAFSSRLFGEDAIKVGTLFRLSGPHGNFWLRSGAQKLVMIASGTGYAPIQALLQQLAESGSTTPLRVYWGARRPADVYAMQDAQALVARLGGKLVPVISNAEATDGWQGRTGFVHQAVLDDLASTGDVSDMRLTHVYACGAPPMVAAAKAGLLGQHGLPESQFYADIFTARTAIS